MDERRKAKDRKIINSSFKSSQQKIYLLTGKRHYAVKWVKVKSARQLTTN